MTHPSSLDFAVNRKSSVAEIYLPGYVCEMTLREHLDELGVKPYLWAEEHSLQKDGVYRHLKKRPVSYETSEAISRATGGKISVLVIYKTGRPSE